MKRFAAVLVGVFALLLCLILSTSDAQEMIRFSDGSVGYVVQSQSCSGGGGQPGSYAVPYSSSCSGGAVGGQPGTYGYAPQFVPQYVPQYRPYIAPYRPYYQSYAVPYSRPVYNPVRFGIGFNIGSY